MKNKYEMDTTEEKIKSWISSLGLDPNSCALCQNNSQLCRSHVIPQFVIDWIKETSATGFLRQVVNPNHRKQDGTKHKLLCKSCETMLSRWENSFSKEIFIPYVEEILNKEQVYSKSHHSITYDIWLLNFCISVQWRGLVTCFEILECDQKYIPILKSVLSTWRKYLRKERSDSGPWRTHLFFFENLASGE
nr:hypothetical protein [uncultured Bdellovibrio sp.]